MFWGMLLYSTPLDRLIHDKDFSSVYLSNCLSFLKKSRDEMLLMGGEVLGINRSDKRHLLLWKFLTPIDPWEISISFWKVKRTWLFAKMMGKSCSPAFALVSLLDFCSVHFKMSTEERWLDGLKVIKSPLEKIVSSCECCVMHLKTCLARDNF